MAVYTFRAVPAWGQPGQFARLGLGAGKRFPVTVPGGGAATVVQGGVTQAGYLLSDANGLIPDWTTTDIPSVVVNFGFGELVVHSLEAITAGASSAAAAAGSATDAAASETNAANSATAAATSASDAATYAGVINVKKGPYNAPTNGSDASSAINAAITANPGRSIFLPAGTYSVDAATAGIKLNQAGTRLLLDPGAVVKVLTNSADSYMAVEVTAADCVIEGGTFLGDGPAHTGTTGEWGHLIVAQAGAHRLRVQGVMVKNAWGDGIAIQNNPADVSIVDCIADDNRRQGLSIISATRPRVLGGVYKNTGLTKFTAPGAGIDVEPNPSSGLSVVDATISNVTLQGNKGAGLLMVSATAVTTDVQVNQCRAIGNGTGSATSGFSTAGSGGTFRATLVGCTSTGSSRDGFELAVAATLTACTARGNTLMGFRVSVGGCTLNDPHAVENGQCGIAVQAGDGTSIVGGSSRANSQTTSGANASVDITGTTTRITGHVSDAGTLTNKPAYGYLIRTGSTTTRLLGCDVRNTFTVGAYNDQTAAAVAFPVPGAAKQSISAAATDAATTQTLANSLRSALIALGYGA